MVRQCEEIKKGFLEFVGSHFRVETAKYGCKITTPFLTLNNDSIKLYFEDLGSERARLSDFGDTLAEFDILGFDCSSSPKRKKIVEELLSSSGMKLADNTIQMTCEFKEIPYAINKFIFGLNSLRHLLLLETPYERYNFAEEVHKAFDNRRLTHKYQDLIEIMGVPFRMDLRIPVAGTNDYGSCIQTFYAEEKKESINKAKAKTYPFLLLQVDKKIRARKVAVVKDLKDSWAPNALTLIEKSSDEIFDWAEKDRIIESLV